MRGGEEGWKDLSLIINVLLGYKLDDCTWEPDHEVDHQVLLPEFEANAYVTSRLSASVARDNS